MIPFVGFSPDALPETPGIILDCMNIIPAIGSFVAAPSPVDAGLGAIDAAAKGFSVNRKLDGTNRVFCGSSTYLYEQVGGVWTDVSRVGNYALGAENRWRFSQFGNVSLAVNKTAVLQFSTTGDFADSGTAPKAEIVETINNQVFLFNIDGMGFGDDVTRWACSAVGSYTDFTPSISTGCVSGQFLDSPGAITAGKRLGDVIVAYKEKAMYVGQFVGAPSWWNFIRVPGDIGAPVQESVVNTGTAHFFIGPDDFYAFDGSRPQALNSPCRNWLFANIDQRHMQRICGSFDRFNQRVFWWFPSKNGGGALDMCVVFNVKTGQWGRVNLTIEFVADFVSGGVTIDGLASYGASIDALPDIPYDSPFWSSGSPVLSVFKADHKAYQLSGAAGESRILTGHYGDNIQFSTCSRVRPRFIRSPTSSTLNYSYSNTDATQFTQNISTTYQNNWYDLIWSARWHKYELIFNGDMSISGFDLVMSPDGSE